MHEPCLLCHFCQCCWFAVLPCCLLYADVTGRWSGKQFSTVPPKTGKAPDVYIDKQVRSLAEVCKPTATCCVLTHAGIYSGHTQSVAVMHWFAH